MASPTTHQRKAAIRNQQIPNHFARVIQRIKDDENQIRNLSFGKLRKTAGNLIREVADGETMAVFHCRGQAVGADDLADVYSNRPYGKVFRALREVQLRLAPVFAAAGSRPFAPQAQAYTSRKAIERIIQLHKEGYPTGQIARAIGVSGTTASRHIQAYLEQQAAEG